jgi:hypothetical protein
MNITQQTKVFEAIVDFANEQFNIDILEKTRRQEVIMARTAAMVAMRQTMSSARVGSFFGRDHATVLHHEKNHSSNYVFSEIYRAVYNYATEVIESIPNERKTYSIQYWKTECQRIREENSELMRQIQMLKHQLTML